MSNIQLRATFNTDAERYHALRPQYPSELFDALITLTHMPDNAKLLEIGPGTGQATLPLAERGYEITAVELGSELAKKTSKTLAAYPKVRVITGAFEDVKLPSQHYDLVYAATAFHWIDTASKFKKPHTLLKANGHLVIIHTEHVSDESGDEFFYASWPIYRKHGLTDTQTDTPGFTLPRLKGLQPPERMDEALFSPESFTVFPMTVTYTSREYAELLGTYSRQLALPRDKRDAFLGEIEELIDTTFGGHLVKHYGMTLTIARKI
ncbi:MAG TPA: class I SAM-dependent methyltransferase [Bacillota bacterium]|nr:class I SAM-dependent methyltransferase [Bacillota bacterium]